MLVNVHEIAHRRTGDYAIEIFWNHDKSRAALNVFGHGLTIADFVTRVGGSLIFNNGHEYIIHDANGCGYVDEDAVDALMEREGVKA